MRRYSRTHLPAPHRPLFSVLQSPRPSTRFEVHPLLFLSPSPSPRVEPSTRQTRSVVLTRYRLANKIWLIAPERFLRRYLPVAVPRRQGTLREKYFPRRAASGNFEIALNWKVAAANRYRDDRSTGWTEPRLSMEFCEEKMHYH